MNSNNLLTYLLYGLLGLFICLAGYKACEMQKEKKQRAAEEAELQKTLRDMGIVEDTTSTAGSTYTNTETPAPAPSSPAAGTPGTGSTAAPSTAKPSTPTTPTTKPTTPVATKPAPTAGNVPPKPAPAAPTKPTVKPSTTTSKGVAAVKGPGSGRWAVRAGTFGSRENALKRLEQVIKAGYPNAEISKTSNGQFAVVVYRSNDKAAAQRVMDKLEDKDIDAAVFDRSKQ
jgi:cytoskeletal protein RodZ